MTANKKIIIKNILYPAAGVMLFFLSWALIAAVYDKPLMLPQPTEIIAESFRLLSGGDFWRRTAFSILRAVAAFGISFVLALVLALLSTVFDVKKVFSPLITIVRAVPTVAVIMLIFIWTDAQITPVIVSVLIIMPVLYSSFLVTLASTDRDLIETGKVFGYGKMGIVRHVYLPGLRRSMLEGTASGLSLSLKVVISAEIFVSTKDSIGQFIKSARASVTAGIEPVLAAAMLTVVFCVLIEFLVRLPINRPYFSDI